MDKEVGEQVIDLVECGHVQRTSKYKCLGLMAGAKQVSSMWSYVHTHCPLCPHCNRKWTNTRLPTTFTI